MPNEPRNWPALDSRLKRAAATTKHFRVGVILCSEYVCARIEVRGELHAAGIGDDLYMALTRALDAVEGAAVEVAL